MSLALEREGARETLTVDAFYLPPDVRNDLLGWMDFHGIEPMTVPRECVIVRDEDRRAIEYTQFVYDPPTSRSIAHLVIKGCEAREHTVIQQGETLPLPFPASLHAEAARQAEAVQP